MARLPVADPRKEDEKSRRDRVRACAAGGRTEPRRKLAGRGLIQPASRPVAISWKAMKTTFFAFCSVLAATALSLAAPAETRAVPTEATGTVSMVNPDTHTFVVSTPDQTTPVVYGYSKTTEVVDETGKQIPWGIVKKKTPVIVQFVVEDGQMIAKKLIVKPLPLPALEQTTTTTTAEQ